MPQSEGGILNDEIIDKLRAAVLAECGIALNRDDPVFSTVILNKIILEGHLEQVETYIQQFVEALSSIIETSKIENGEGKGHTQAPQSSQGQPESPDGIKKALHHNRTKLLEELSPIIEEKLEGLRQPKPITELILVGLVVGVISLAANTLFHFYILPPP